MKDAEPLYDEKGIKLPLCEQPLGLSFKPSEIGIWARKSASPFLRVRYRYAIPPYAERSQ